MYHIERNSSNFFGITYKNEWIAMRHKHFIFRKQAKNYLNNFYVLLMLLMKQ
jgi:hypothetical protein